MTKNQWQIRVAGINKRMTEEAIKWWKENEHKLYDPDLEYPINEKLPMLESDKSFTEEIRSVSSRLSGEYKAEIYNMISDLRDSGKLTQEECKLVELYWESNKSVGEICVDLGISHTAFRKKKQRLINHVLTKKKEI